MNLEDLNILYRKTLLEDVELKANENYTLEDFGKACEIMQLPFFEVVQNHNNTITTKMYQSYTEFRKSMPEWTARKYDLVNDHPTEYYEIAGIAKGYFKIVDTLILDEQNQFYYKAEFLVTNSAVLARTETTNKPPFYLQVETE